MHSVNVWYYLLVLTDLTWQMPLRLLQRQTGRECCTLSNGTPVGRM